MAQDTDQKNVSSKFNRKLLIATGGVGLGVGTIASGGLALGALPFLGGLYALRSASKDWPEWRNQRIDEWDASELVKLQDDYINEIGFGPDVTFGSKAFEDLLAKTDTTYTVFANAKLPSGSSIKEKLAENSASAEVIKERLHSVLENSKTKLKEQQTEYEATIAEFKTLATEKVPNPYSVEKLIDYYYLLKSDARKELEKTQQAELDELSKEFTKQDFRDAIKNEFKSEDYDAIKDSMLADLKKAHKEQQDTFDKATSEALVKIQDAAAKEMNAAIFIGNLERLGLMKKEIEEQRAEIAKRKSQTESQKAGVQIGENIGSISVAGIDPAKLGNLIGKSGKIIERNDDGSYKIILPKYSQDKIYYASLLNNEKADLLLMAEAVKAIGGKSIRTTIDAPIPPATEEMVKEHARLAYEVNIKAGFPPDKITIVVNNKELKYKLSDDERKNKDSYATIQDELYQGRPEFDTLQEESKRVIGTFKKIHKTEDELKSSTQNLDSFKELKEDLKTLKEKAKMKKEEAEALKLKEQEEAQARQTPPP